MVLLLGTHDGKNARQHFCRLGDVLGDLRLPIGRGDRSTDRHRVLSEQMGDRRQLRCADERQNPRQQPRGLDQVLCDVGLPVGRTHHGTDRQGVLPEKLRENQRLLPGGRGLGKRLTQLVGPDLADILPGLDLAPGLELGIWPAESGAALAGELTERITLEERRPPAVARAAASRSRAGIAGR
jgi:hypothetical protein